MAVIRKRSAVQQVDLSFFIRNESPTQLPETDGQTFATKYDFIQNSLIVTLNGMRMRPGAAEDYVELGDRSFRFNFPIDSGDRVVCDYTKTSKE